MTLLGWAAYSPRLFADEFLVVAPGNPSGGVFHGEGFVLTDGYQFTVGSAPLSLLSLGVYDWSGSGLVNSHQVGLWDADGNLLSTTTITAGPSTNGFCYSSVTPVLLEAGQSYIMGATYVNLDVDKIGTSIRYDNIPPVYNPAIFYDVCRYGISDADLTFPVNSEFSYVLGYFGPNAEIVVVPEPSTSLLLSLPVFLLLTHLAFTRRFYFDHNFD